VFFNRLGEIRDRSFERQRYRASGLNLVTAAIVLWNTAYLERAAHGLRSNGHAVDDALPSQNHTPPMPFRHLLQHEKSDIFLDKYRLRHVGLA
jgi:hypothetical protein